MAEYFFYFWTADHICTAMEVVSRDSDTEASVEAIKMLTNHTTCAYVEVWDGDQKVGCWCGEAAAGLRVLRSWRNTALSLLSRDTVTNPRESTVR